VIKLVVISLPGRPSFQIIYFVQIAMVPEV